ncbi:MAG: dihydropteroate synthase [Terriglobales bacterium]
MAILNLTPDSFYAASRSEPGDLAAVAARAQAAVAAGADVLDLGAESTRPGSTPLDPAEELRRLLPALAAVRRALPDTLISADTRHALVARAALEAGADLINDVTAGADPAMLPLLSASSCGLVLMHARGEFRSMPKLPPLPDPLEEVERGLAAILDRAAQAGIAPERILLDPGFGFGKNMDENFPLLAGLDRLHALGCPLLAGLSRKSFLRSAPGQDPGERLPASLAALTAAVLAGAHMLRVHDPGATVQALRVCDKLLASCQPACGDVVK